MKVATRKLIESAICLIQIAVGTAAVTASLLM